MKQQIHESDTIKNINSNTLEQCHEMRLLNIKEIINGTDLDKIFSPPQVNYLLVTKNWVFNYLMRPNKELGRSGPVCPFVPKAVRENSIYLSIISTDHFQKPWFYKTVLDYLECFKSLLPTNGNKSIFRSIILIIDIPSVNTHGMIEQTIIDLKGTFVKNRMMLGEFHSGPPNNKGIRNPDFRPLACPVPLLVIREMVETDVEFLKSNPDYMTHYNDFFPDNPISPLL